MTSPWISFCHRFDVLSDVVVMAYDRDFVRQQRDVLVDTVLTSKGYPRGRLCDGVCSPFCPEI